MEFPFLRNFSTLHSLRNLHRKYHFHTHSLVTTTTVQMALSQKKEVERKRWYVVSLYKEGLTETHQITRRTGYSRKFVRDTINRFLETGGVEDRPRSGRPRKLSSSDLRSIKRSMSQKKTGSTRKTQQRLKRKRGVEVHDTTVWRATKRLKMSYRIRPKKPLLTGRHKRERLRFARTRRRKKFWNSVLWSDEASFALYSSTRGEWVLDGEEPTPRQTVKWPHRIRVWAGIASCGKTKLIKIPKAMDADAYIDMLRKKGIPAAQSIFGEGAKDWVLMQDGDGSHTAKKTLNFLQNEGIRLLHPWPARSPDLNPIENAWGMVEDYLQYKNPTTARGLWHCMKRAWETIDSEKLCNLCGSVPRRLQAVIDSEGGNTKY